MWLPPHGSRVVVAMSGGVDSSVTAAWLKHEGYDVIGVSLQLHDASEQIENKYGTCCTLSDIGDARRVAEKIGIPFYVSDMEVEFRTAVIDDFLNEYIAGRTPNPCVQCNEKVKFSRLLDWALDLGADYLATGHYALVEKTDRFELHRGVYPEKDQSYFLFSIRQEDLARCLFPMGGLSKNAVRELAREYGLAVANKPDSQEICFVQGRKYQDFVEENVPETARQPGPIVNEVGELVGEHRGLYNFTIGQRKGLGVNSLEPLYVTEIDPALNRVVVGSEAGLFKKRCRVERMHWINGQPDGRPLKAKIRYRSRESTCRVDLLADSRCEVEFESAQRAITPGQAIVFYDGSRVAGGGWIGDLCV
ncbi:MAG: tRNA 2-thiouridine(34) synthase MnmA [Deltaproteobacteria bacterium]|nr:tRNA 2-thiouridine(34) synthase MnmA [Deltaproteobacteria bacterium]MBI3293104.1 tRNA 2-thiouridine(34) synthase MnmA [Deltaproteobacteria bacterium]